MRNYKRNRLLAVFLVVTMLVTLFPLAGFAEEPLGPTGSPGPTGPTRLAEPVGPTGSAGPTGPTRLAEPVVPAGPTGPEGSTGLIGPTGPARLAEPVGPTGPQNFSNELPADYVDNSNNGLYELLESRQSQSPMMSLMAGPAASDKKVDLVFVIDSTGSMYDEINNVKLNITSFVQGLESQGVSMRIGIVEYRDIDADGLDSTIVHTLNYSPWLSNTTQMVEKLASIEVDGGGDRAETVIDGLGYLVDDETMLWRSDAHKFAIVLTDADYKVDNRHGYTSLQQMADELASRRINTSVITDTYFSGYYTSLTNTTGGEIADIYSDFQTVLNSLAARVLDVTLKPVKAIYVLPGYLGSKIYGDNGTGDEKFLDYGYILSRVLYNEDDENEFRQNDDGSPTGVVNVDPIRDEYGPRDTYESLVEELKDNFADEYDVIFFPFNWLGDLNDSVVTLENDIKKNGYTDVVFVTHSTGGLLASAFIAKSPANKLKVKKAVLIAAPLFGTYASLFPLERGDSRKITKGGIGAALTDAGTNNKWVRGWAENSPTTYQLLPSEEYLQYHPLLDKRGWGDGEESITSADRFYWVLNQSDNINSNLTNGNSRSHKAFRETSLGGDVISEWSLASLLETDVLLIGTAKGHSTTSVAVYNEPLIGTDRKLKDIQYNKNGDGTVQGFSAKAQRKGDPKPILRTDFNYTADHSDLLKNSDVLQSVCNEIRSIGGGGGFRMFDAGTFGAEAFGAGTFGVRSLGTETGMSDQLKINYSGDKPITATIYDDNGVVVAQATGDDYTGFDGDSFIYDSFADIEAVTEASIYMPNQGYRIVFSCGTEASVPVAFYWEVSTLSVDGWKNISVMNNADFTIEDGVIMALDGTVQAITDENLASIIPGVVVTRYTEWELPETIRVDKGDTLKIEPIGIEASDVAPLLQWYSSDESIVAVSVDGTITANDFGRATISATNGNKSSVCQVVVVQEATSVSLADINMVIGERTLIRPQFAPATATETDLTYLTDKAGIVEINEYGVILALKAGSVTITGETSYGVRDTFVVTVIDGKNYPVQSIAMNKPEVSVETGKNAAVNVKFTPENASNKELNWFIEDAAIISVAKITEGATITGLAEGTTKLTAVSIDGGYSAVCTVTVTKPGTSGGSSGGGGGGGGGMVKPVSASLNSGAVAVNSAVTLTSIYKDAVIYYTVDGTTPNTNSAKYTGPIIIGQDTTLKLFAVHGRGSTPVATYNYTVQPADSVKAGFKPDASSLRYIKVYADNTFKPDQAITRYEVIESLANLLNIDRASSALTFSDVDARYKDLVDLYAGAGIINGFEDNTFRGNQGLTRAEFVKILSLILQLDLTDNSGSFNDIAGHWAQGHINAFEKLGYLKGYPDGSFKPDQRMSRAEFVVIVNRIIGAQSASPETALSDLDTAHWAYGDIMAAYLK